MGSAENLWKLLGTFWGRLFSLYIHQKNKKKSEKLIDQKTAINDSCNTHELCQWIKFVSDR